MTTIAVNKTELAGDRQCTHSGGMKFKIKTKLHSFYTPSIYPVPFHVGLCGNLDIFMSVLTFLKKPEEYKKAPRFKGSEAIVLTEDGKIWTFSDPSSWIVIDQPFYAVGSGMTFAMGAMEAGLSPKEAVRAASKHDPSTGMGVTSIKIG